ncbi:MAG: beta-carotene 15,15'-monooxygenase [Chryseobacterium sp.]|uniref:beta-carotene 15,15'-monooxygenase n=1 Tax=Epilithonimonas caeni TaxID=365343 RepID=UPI0004166A11|nr:beta-carotene 15,15'-monooxygenase [Epilithonimonas caeni]MPS74597.1 beta-carotene 15,15'-monooxygenase [Chryseobacterium sp.]
MENFNEFDSQATSPNREAGAIISHALEIFKNTFLYCFLAVVIYFLLGFLVQMVTGFNSQLLVEQIKDSGGNIDYQDIIAAPGFAAYSGANFLVTLLLTPIFVSLIYVANKSNFKQQITVSDIFFAYRQNFINIFIYALLSQIALTILFFMCILPALFAMPLFFLGYPILLFEKASAFDALKKSFNIVQENYGTILLTAILAGLISIAGIVLCCVGVYLTLPFAYIAMYSTYCAYCGTPRQIEQYK